MNHHYYNEFDPRAAAWLRELMSQKLIPQGVIDERDIKDVRGGDLAGFVQCHLFAGIGGWPLALKLAGWPEDEPVWTGSCPCQPFSGAGKKKGKRDPRHLWPEFKRLIGERKPAIVFGEQVASAAGRVWLDGVFADLEALAYAVAGADLCAAGVGAPHIRQRLWWMADAMCAGRSAWRTEPRNGQIAGSSGVGRLADTASERWQRRASAAEPSRRSFIENGGATGGMEHTNSSRCGEQCRSKPMEAKQPGFERASGDGRMDDSSSDQRESRQQLHGQNDGQNAHDGRIVGAWSNFDIIACRDGKARRIESGTFPLADGFPGRVAILRGYGNAIVPHLAAEFIQACVEAMNL